MLFNSLDKTLLVLEKIKINDTSFAGSPKREL